MTNVGNESKSTPAAPTLEDHLSGKPPEVVALFDRFVAAMKECGPVDVRPQKDVVVLRSSRRILAGVRLTKRGLRGNINLPRQIDDPRFTTVEPLTRRLFFHRFVLSSLSQLDGEFIGWLREAYLAGQGMRRKSEYLEVEMASE